MTVLSVQESPAEEEQPKRNKTKNSADLFMFLGPFLWESLCRFGFDDASYTDKVLMGSLVQPLVAICYGLSFRDQ